MTDAKPEIYRVQVLKLVPGSNQIWTKTFDRTSSALSPLGAMRAIVEAEVAKEMLKNQHAINAEPDPGGSWEQHPFHVNNAKPKKR